MSEMNHKKNRVLACLLAGVLISPVAGGRLQVTTVVSEVNSAESLYQLGVMRMNGEGAEQDIVQGRYWIHLAARHGYPLAQYNLGVMYFDGIGGAYSRPCAQWWLNKAAGQDDPEVREMASQALRRIEPEMAVLPKVYRPVTGRDCDRLPEWQREVQSVADIPVLPQGGIDTEAEEIVQELPVTEYAVASEEHSVASLVPESVVAKTEIAAVKETTTPEQISSEKEPVDHPTLGASEIETKTEVMVDQKTPPENTGEAVIRTDSSSSDYTTSAVEVAEPKSSKTDIEFLTSAVAMGDEPSVEKVVTSEPTDIHVSVDDGVDNKDITSTDPGIIPVPDVESFRTTGRKSTGIKAVGMETLSGSGGKNTEMPADVRPEKPKTVKPSEVRPAAVPAKLNLGGSPATAPSKHYTLQLSGGTTRDELYRTVRKHKLTNYLVYETVRHGQSWYVLVAGEYATLTAANQALKMLPAELRKNGPWVRALRQVQDELK